MPSALERLVPACPVVGFGRPCFITVVHGAIVESGCVLDVDGGRSCRSVRSLLSAEVRFHQPYMRLYQDRHCIR